MTVTDAFDLSCVAKRNEWNRIEHRLFCHMTQNWRGRPPMSRDVVVDLIGATTTKQWLGVRVALAECEHPLGRKVTDDEMERLEIKREGFHGEWNYHLSSRGYMDRSS